MIRYNIKELTAKREYEEKRKITLTEIASSVGISRITLYRMSNPKGNFSTKTEYIEKLCKYFNCGPESLMTIVPDPGEEQCQDREN